MKQINCDAYLIKFGVIRKFIVRIFGKKTIGVDIAGMDDTDFSAKITGYRLKNKFYIQKIEKI